MEVTQDFTWTVRLQGQLIDLASTHLAALPSNLQSVANITAVLDSLDSCHFCPGNSDAKFIPLQASRKGVFRDTTSKCMLGCLYCSLLHNIGTLEVACYIQDYFPYHTIRHSACSIVVAVSGRRCVSCVAYRRVLTSMLSRTRKVGEKTVSSSDPVSHTNYRFVTFK